MEGRDLRATALAAIGKLPPFSPTLNRLLASLAQEDVSFGRIADLIEKDTVLAGNVLRLVNSALYGRGATINSVRHAVSLLGVNKLRNGILGISVMRLWHRLRVPDGWSMARFNLHSVATGLLADLIAQSGPVEYPEGAFTAGLFHDLGRLLIAMGLPEEHAQILMLSPRRHFSQSECEMEVLGFTHADLSGDALTRWNLPEKICAAVRNHHNPDSRNLMGESMSLSSAILVADEYVNAIGYSIEDCGAWPLREQAATQAIARLEALQLHQPVPALLEVFTAELEAIRGMF